MEPWEIGLTVGILLAGAIAVGVILYFALRRRRPPLARRVERPEEALLRQARQISERFRGIAPPRLDVAIPLPEWEASQQEVDDFNSLAETMAESLRRATLYAEIAKEENRGSQAIVRAQEQIEEKHALAVEEITQAYTTLGLEPPPMRTEQEIQAARRRLRQAMGQLQGMV